MKRRISSLPALLASAAIVAASVLATSAPAIAQPHSGARAHAPRNNFGCTYYYGTGLTEYGDRGPRVRQVQCLLSKWDLMDPSEIDGIFGQHTRDVVRGFQHDLGLDPDGKVGVKTWGALRCEGPSGC
ncbi:peptidoglycan-binding domain-containing protein [Streptomyces sp. RPT161]|uniref:peptidoglycan-binding domain-containing protein n=1 Tax=Streptomyces sp. RPT161 TaxID=3015993 RepID=UPI0022B8BC98|nr:peptidoglycan-binding domain-containing protein [Streptomyces sp. RPT161]